ncbi:SDR family NAD(P)-dependent oxidoreductase [Desulfofundulus thermocisternus]|uniref:SDR family NAD(P)-dependent oxidoreductase n=1 Tax=Desulfofundulus thermocisternus TaxID=42471 RepID=UPI0040470788
MHVLVTGGAGYIGSHTVKELLRAGYKVTVLDNLFRGHRSAMQLLRGADFIQGDIADRELVAELLKNRGIRAVMHFAALSLTWRQPMCWPCGPWKAASLPPCIIWEMSGVTRFGK